MAEKKKAPKKPVIGYGTNMGAGKKATNKAVKKVVKAVAKKKQVDYPLAKGAAAKPFVKAAIKNAKVQMKKGAASKSSRSQMMKNDLRYNLSQARAAMKAKKK